jgi:drug/metabolite transporter (DMT)-like permease
LEKGETVLSDNTKGILYAITTAVLWGFLAIALKIAVGGIDPFTIVWFRFLLSFILLSIYFYFKYRPKLSILIKPPYPLVIAALFLGVNYLGFMLGLKYTSPNSAQVVMQIGPVILVFVGVFIYKEKLSRRQIVGLAITLLGLMLFYGEQISIITSADLFNMGMMWIFIGSISWVVYASLQKSLVRKFQPQQLNLFLYGLPALLYTPIASPRILLDVPSIYILMLVFAGLNTLFAYGAFAEALKYTEANKVSVIIICNPIITIIVMWFLNNFDIAWLEKDPISSKALLYALLVLGGAALTIFKRSKNYMLKKNLRKKHLIDTPVIIGDD